MAEQTKGLGSFFDGLFGSSSEAFLLFLILILLILSFGFFDGMFN